MADTPRSITVEVEPPGWLVRQKALELAVASMKKGEYLMDAHRVLQAARAYENYLLGESDTVSAVE